MEKELKKLMEFYKCSFVELAGKIGCSLRHLYRVKKGEYTGKFLRDRIEDMLQKIESL